ncbi:type II toxin-antitoxin system HicB family antitoxin [Candidatus Peregrinibacteria bacterium]|nr:type II toxin-antitoxin system HicB family antitoxin [Candidatus Peregrinibacteria bacterium]
MDEPTREYLDGLPNYKVEVDGETYEVSLEPAPDGKNGTWAFIESMPGCTSFGETVEEVLKNIREAIKVCKENG